MAGSINKVILVGNVGKEPEVRHTQNNRAVATFSLATTDSWTDKLSNTKKERTEWHKIVVFSAGLVDVVKNYVHTGTKLYIEGSIQTNKWTDQAGIERYSTTIVLQGFNSALTILSSKEGSGSVVADNLPVEPTSREAEHKIEINDLDDEIPF